MEAKILVPILADEVRAFIADFDELLMALDDMQVAHPAHAQAFRAVAIAMELRLRPRRNMQQKMLEAASVDA